VTCPSHWLGVPLVLFRLCRVKPKKPSGSAQSKFISAQSIIFAIRRTGSSNRHTCMESSQHMQEYGPGPRVAAIRRTFFIPQFLHSAMFGLRIVARVIRTSRATGGTKTISSARYGNHISGQQQAKNGGQLKIGRVSWPPKMERCFVSSNIGTGGFALHYAGGIGTSYPYHLGWPKNSLIGGDAGRG
jgi:hypothetical protein